MSTRRLTAAIMLLGLLGGACGEAPEPEPQEEPASETHKSSSELAREEALSREIDPSKPQLAITAAGVAFDTDRLVAPAGEEFQIVLTNEDDLEHNISVFETVGGVPVFRHPLFRGELVRGPVEVVYDVPALPKGRFIFYCDAHIAEKMKGEFIVK